jgi:membrane protein YdbS with pleckstrin-like domain
MDDEWRLDPPLDYHDPTAGIGGAPAAASALTLRILLASAAVVACVAGIVLTILVSGPAALIVLLAIVAATAIVDLWVITLRRRRGRSGDRTQKDSD